MQTGLTIGEGKITGTLLKQTSGALADYWGEGYFMALKFTDPGDTVTSIKVGLDPSVSSGLVELDEDMNGVFKVTNKSVQKFKVFAQDGGSSYTQLFDLSELTLS